MVMESDNNAAAAADDDDDDECGGGSGGGGNPMHRTHRILMRAIGWVAVKICLTSGVPAGAGSYCGTLLYYYHCVPDLAWDYPGV